VRKADGVVLSIAGTVVLGNGEGFTLEGLAGGERSRESAALDPIHPRHFRVRSTTLQTEMKARVGSKGRVCLAMTSSLVLPYMHLNRDLHTP